MSVLMLLSLLLINLLAPCSAQFGFSPTSFQIPNLNNFLFPGAFNQQQQNYPQRSNYQSQPYYSNYNQQQIFYQIPNQQPVINPQRPAQIPQRPLQNPQQPLENPQRPAQNPQRPAQNPQRPTRSTQRPQTHPPTTGRPINPTLSPNARISAKKCREYSYVSKGPSVAVASLSLDADVQNIKVDNCDASIGLVVGGEDAKKGEFPHMAALGYPAGLEGDVSFKCGGSLISERFVLTAAHCKKADRVEPKIVRLGDLNLKLREPELPETDVPIVRFIAHERYSRQTMHNDIAVVQMDRNVSFSNKLRPACLAQPEIPLKAKAVASGWGFLETGGRTADILQKVELSIISNRRCKEIYKDQTGYNINTKKICAGELAGGKDTCQGDSGGPLQITSDSNKCMYIIIGITSYGPTFCGQADQPGIYTRVSEHLDWIEQKVWDN